MSEIVFRRSGWIPYVVRDGDQLRLELGAGNDGLHSPRTFSFPIEQEHLDVIGDDLARHLLLWVAIVPLCDAAGIRGELDEDAAIRLRDTILLGTAADVDALFREKVLITTALVAHGADIPLLERGQLVDSLHSATEESRPQIAQAYVANRDRERRGVRLGPLDEAVLKYTGHYLHSSTRPGRHPDAVEPALLAEVLAVIATAEGASARLSISPRTSSLDVEAAGGRSAERRHSWQRMSRAVTGALRRRHPRLAEDCVRSVAFLMCSEAASGTGKR